MDAAAPSQKQLVMVESVAGLFFSHYMDQGVQDRLEFYDIGPSQKFHVWVEPTNKRKCVCCFSLAPNPESNLEMVNG